MTTLQIVTKQYANTSATKNLVLSIVGDVTWSDTPVYPTYIYDQKVSLKLGALNDTFEFKYPDYNSTTIGQFNIQDKIYMYYCINGASAVDSTNLIIQGLTKMIEVRCTPESKFIHVTGISFGEVMVNAVSFADMTNVTAFEYLKQLLEYIKLKIPKFPVTWNSGNPLLNKYNNTTKLYDGDTLPKMNGGGRASYFNWSMDKYLERFLNEQYTGDGRYFWYINSSNELVIRKMLYDPQGSITEGTTPLVSYSVSNDTSDIRNFIVVKCGSDPVGNPVSTYYYDPVSAAQYGFRYYMIKTTDAEILLQNCRQVGSWASDSTYPPSYPFTCPWKDEAGNTVTVSSNSEFINALRTQAKVQGRKAGEAFAAAHNKGYKQLTLELPPTFNWHVGDIVNCTFPSYGLTDLKVRVYQIDYSNTNTVLTLKEEYLNSL